MEDFFRDFDDRSEGVQWLFRVAPVLALFWAVLSGHLDFLFITLGVASLALVCWIQLRTEVSDRDYVPLRMAVRLLTYLPWLSKEVLFSSLAVLRRIWSPRLELRPAMAVVPSRDMSVLAQVIYANSITLTPGTLSLTVDDEGIEVHGLDEPDVEALVGGEMSRRIRHLDGVR